MKNNIELKDIESFKSFYESNNDNLVAESKIKDLGLKKASVNEQILNDYNFNFNVTVPETKIYNQRSSQQCNIYAFLRVVKDIMRKRGLEDIDLSANYIAFFDKLEKINTLYSELIGDDNLTIDKIRDKTNRYVGNYGTFHFCLKIINKYGIVPEKEMPDVNDKYNEFLTIELLRDKIKSDALLLMNKKEDKEKLKKTLMNEAYNFLAKVYGTPPLDFTINGSNYTPLQFKEWLTGDSLDNFVTVTSINIESFYNSNAYIPGIYINNNEEVRYLDHDNQKKAILKQLKSGISVWFSTEESKTLDYKDDILDTNLYDYNHLLSIRDISKGDKIALGIIDYDHAMAITGALVENDEIKQFKVDNSFGYHGQFKGRILMTSDYFDNYVITTIIDKRFLEEIE